MLKPFETYFIMLGCVLFILDNLFMLQMFYSSKDIIVVMLFNMTRYLQSYDFTVTIL